MDSRYKNRELLKSYFQKGNVPTEEQFAELIDSVHNVQEDGRVKTSDEGGMHLFPSGTSGTVATVFAEEPGKGAPTPLWRLTLGKDGSLSILDDKGETAVTIGRNRGKDVPSDTDTLKVNADGYWHDLPMEAACGREPAGCRVYRITACYLNRRSGKYSTCTALASHSGGKRHKIRSPRKHWWGWSGHIKVRWQRRDGKLYLQMGSKDVSSGSETIFYRIETAWEL